MVDESHGAMARAARTQAIALVLRGFLPILLAEATRRSGLDAYGRFATAQAAVFLACRFALLGLDRALAVACAELLARGESIPLGRAALRIAFAAALSGLGIASFLRLAWGPGHGPMLVFAALGALPVAAVELFAQLAIARDRFVRAVIVRDVVQPVLALGLVFLPLGGGGAERFALAFFAATSVSAVALGAPLARDGAMDGSPRGRLPDPVIGLAGRAFFADVVATAGQRLDVLVLALVADGRVIGSYGVLLQFALTLRGLRLGLEPMVQKRIAERCARGDLDARGVAHEIRAACRATWKMQLPFAAFFVVFASPLLAWFGADDAPARVGLVVVTLGQLASTSFAFDVPVLHGLGRGGSAATAVALGLLVQSALFAVLVPPIGLVGASVASACAVVVPGLVARRSRRSAHAVRTVPLAPEALP